MDTKVREEIIPMEQARQAIMKIDVQSYWNKQPCNTKQGAPFKEGSLEFFEKIEQDRYENQGFIHQFVQFPKWYKKDVLEVGCGIGTDALQFVKSGAYYDGIDASMMSIDLAEKQIALYGFYPSEVRFSIMDAERMSYENNLFDLVYSWGVIHHSPNPEKVVSEIYRVLKPGGVLKAMIYHRFSTMGFAVYLRDVKRYRNPFVSLRTAFSRSLESPGTKAFSFREIRELFQNFSGLKIEPNFTPELIGLKNTPFLSLLKYYPNGLASWICVEGVKE